MWLTLMWFSVLLPKIIGQYHQNDYSVNLHRVQMMAYNHSVIKDLQGGYILYNRTTRAFNGSGYLAKDISMDLKVQVQLYKFLSNEYRFFPITMNSDGQCDYIKLDPFGIRGSFQKSVNRPIACPFKQGLYSVHYGTVDFSKFPPFMPGGDYKAEMKIYDGFNFLVELHIYGKITEILKIW